MRAPAAKTIVAGAKALQLRRVLSRIARFSESFKQRPAQCVCTPMISGLTRLNQHPNQQ